MTRARALKNTIRERAARTGERYTTARRRVLAALAPHAQSVPATLPATSLPATATLSTSTARSAPARGSVSEARVVEKTGHDLDHWFALLDRFGGVEKGHTAAARHLHVDHQVPGWYAQSITVAYERARGVRVLNQRRDGEFEVSVSKVLPADTAMAIKAFTDTRIRRRWIGGVDPELSASLTSAVTGKTSRGFVVRPDGLARFRYTWDGTIVQLSLTPKPGGKVSLVVQHTKLAGPAVETRRSQWRAAFAALAASLTG